MAVYREGFYAKEQIEANSIQIFNDACDFGAPTKQYDILWNYAKQLVEWYGEKDSIERHRYSTGRSCKAIVTLIDEWAVSDGRKTERQATEKYVVEFVSCTTGECKGYDGYINIYKK